MNPLAITYTCSYCSCLQRPLLLHLLLFYSFVPYLSTSSQFMEEQVPSLHCATSFQDIITKTSSMNWPSSPVVSNKWFNHDDRVHKASASRFQRYILRGFESSLPWTQPRFESPMGLMLLMSCPQAAACHARLWALCRNASRACGVVGPCDGCDNSYCNSDQLHCCTDYSAATAITINYYQ